MKNILLPILALILLASASCSKKDGPKPKYQDVKYTVLCYGCTAVIDDELGSERTFKVQGKFEYEFTNFNYTEVSLKAYPINPFGIPIMAQAIIQTNDGKKIEDKRETSNIKPIELTLKLK